MKTLSRKEIEEIVNVSVNSLKNKESHRLREDFKLLEGKNSTYQKRFKNSK